MKTTTINLPEHVCHVGDTVWLYPTGYNQIPRGMYRVVWTEKDSFMVSRSWFGDTINRVFYA